MQHQRVVGIQLRGGVTIDYAEDNPTTYLTGSEWCSGTGAIPNTGDNRWRDDCKTLYDPCPKGYQVPKGDNEGVWSTALADTTISVATRWDSVNHGRYWILADGETTAWYPAVGSRSNDRGTLRSVGSNGDYWSASVCWDSYSYAYNLYVYNSSVMPANYGVPCNSYPVRCIKE